MKRRTRRKKKFLDQLIVMLWQWLAIFVLLMIITFWVKDSIPETLVERVMTIVGGEFLCTASITIIKKFLDRGNKDADISDVIDGGFSFDESDNGSNQEDP